MNLPIYYPLGIAISFGLGLVASALASFLGRRGEGPTGPRWGAALGLGVGYVLAHATISEWLVGDRLREARAALAAWMAEGGAFPFFPLSAYDWLPWLAAAATLLAVLDGTIPSPRWARWENRLLLTGLTLGLLLAPLFGGTWEPAQGGEWLVGLGLGMMAFWGVIDARAERLGSSMTLVLMLMAAAASISLILSGSFVLALFMGSLAASLGGVWLVSWADRRITLARGAVPVFVVISWGLVLSGLFYSELPRASALALAASPIATFADRIPAVSRLSPRKVAAIRLAALMIPLAVAVGVAIAMRPAEVVYSES